MSIKWYWVVVIAVVAGLAAIALSLRGKVPASIASALTPKPAVA